jgi:hypothetical protein
LHLINAHGRRELMVAAAWPADVRDGHTAYVDATGFAVWLEIGR